MAGCDELFSGRHDDAIRRLRRVIELDPNSSFAHGMLSAAYAFGGEADLAIQQAENGNQAQPARFLECRLAHHERLGASQRRAISKGSRVREAGRRLESAFADAHGVLASALGHLGEWRRRAPASTCLPASSMAASPTSFVARLFARLGNAASSARLTRPFSADTPSSKRAGAAGAVMPFRCA